MTKKIITTLTICFVSTLLLCAGGPYKITKILPNKKILIGKKMCGKGDLFYENQIVHWDKELTRQAFEADDIINPSITIAMSKMRVRSKSSKDISYKELCGLVGKGESDYIILWAGDSLKLNIPIDSTYIYKLHIEGSYDYKDINPVNGRLYLTDSSFNDTTGIVKFEIVKQKNWDIENVKQYTVELIK